MQSPNLAGRQWRRWLFVMALALAGCGGGGGGAPSTGPAPTEPVGRVVNSTVQSVQVGASYQIKVFLPQSYDASSTTTYPVIYATEGDAPFGVPSGSGSAGGLVPSRFDTFKEAMQRRGTQAILVGIGGTDRRATDFLLPGAIKYLDFIVKELVPAIEAQYRVNPQKRALSGLSHGGYFVNAALFTEGMAGTLHFSHYLSTESSTGGSFGPAALYAFEQQLYDSGKPLPVTLHLGAAAPGFITNNELVVGLYDRMLARNYSGLTLVKAVFNTTHVGADVPAFEDALVRFFP